MATLATLQAITNQPQTDNVQIYVHLIEPSNLALNIACYKIAQFAQALGLNVYIEYQNCELGDANLPVINNTGDVLHLMSYILDVSAVQSQLDGICKKILALPNNHFVVASDFWSKTNQKSSLGFGLLSSKLTGKQQRIFTYSVTYNTYRPTECCYERHVSKAIRMVIELSNYSTMVA